MSEQVFRYEYKYLVGEQTAALLRCQLAALLRPDEHGDSGGRYFVRSVYFDDDALSAYYDKLAGVSVRTKYRLRFYDMDAGHIFFEVKRRRGQRMAKSSVPVSRACAERMLSEKSLPRETLTNPILAEFDALWRAGGLRPRVIADYTRTAFTHPFSETRVTLDSDVCAETYCLENVFVRHASAPVLEDGMVVLEVKFNEQLPPFVAQWLSGAPKILCANSKYCGCLSMFV